MTSSNKFRLEQKTKRRYFLLRLELGCRAVISDRKKLYALIGYVIFMLLVWLLRVPLFGLGADDLLGEMRRIGFENLFRVGSVAGFVSIIMLVGMPFGGKSIHENLQRIGFANSAGETPLLVAEYADKRNPQVRIMEFTTNGIPLTEWEAKRDKIEAALNIHAVKIKQGENKRRMLLYAVAAGNGLPKVLHWDNSYLCADSFVLVLGESLLGRVTVNLAQIPHILLGGSTGSGKSVLLKLLLMQCIQKRAAAYIADFKGGVDFSHAWHGRCDLLARGTPPCAGTAGCAFPSEPRSPTD